MLGALGAGASGDDIEHRGCVLHGVLGGRRGTRRKAAHGGGSGETTDVLRQYILHEQLHLRTTQSPVAQTAQLASKSALGARAPIPWTCAQATCACMHP